MGKTLLLKWAEARLALEVAAGAEPWSKDKLNEKCEILYRHIQRFARLKTQTENIALGVSSLLCAFEDFNERPLLVHPHLRAELGIFKEKTFDIHAVTGVAYGKLLKDLRAKLENELRVRSIGEAVTARVADALLRDRQALTVLRDPERSGPAIDFLVVALRSLPHDLAEAPEIWTQRTKSKRETPAAFLRRVYGDRLGLDGDLTQAELSRIDVGLYTALRRQFKSQKDQLSALLPTVGERRDTQFQREYGYIPKGDDRKRKLMALSRKQRPTP